MLNSFDTYRSTTIAALLLAILSFSCTSDDHMQEDDEKAIREISNARAKAFNDGNAAAIASYFAEDALLMVPGKPIARGRAAVQQYYQSLFDEYTTELESHYEEVEVSGRLAYGRGYAKVAVTPRNGGPPILSTAKYLNIMKKQENGIWKTTHDIWNANE